MMMSTNAGTLDSFRGKNRLLVFALPADDHAQSLAKALAQEQAGLQERDLVVIDASEQAHELAGTTRLTPEANREIRRSLKLDAKSDKEVFVLIGKDGGEKARQLGRLDLQKTFALIDTMPMRREEMRQR